MSRHRDGRVASSQVQSARPAPLTVPVAEPVTVAEPSRPALPELYSLSKSRARVQVRLVTGDGPSLIAGIICKADWSEPRPVSDVLACGHSHLAQLASDQSIQVRILE